MNKTHSVPLPLKTRKQSMTVKVVAETFRQNPLIDSETVITELGVGEVLASVLNKRGEPTLVEIILCCPPQSLIGPADESLRKEIVKDSPLFSTYTKQIDRESAYEQLKRREEKLTTKKPAGRRRQGLGETLFKSILRTVGRDLGRMLVRGVLGSYSRR